LPASEIPPMCSVMTENRPPVLSLPQAFGAIGASGVIRSCPEDFFVEEIPPCEPDGEGEHVLLKIEKRGDNTEWVARQLARFADVPMRDVSYAGLKDRHAVTQQWFSIRLAGKPEPDWQVLTTENLKILDSARHRRKLRRGALRGNRFVIRVRELKGDRGQLESQLRQIQQQGIPNYFGEQRFGHNGDNLKSAQLLFSGDLGRVSRQRRGLYISAARSLLFNQVLAKRVELGNWNQILLGERVALQGSRSSFHAEVVDAELQTRLDEMDIHPTGPLWGRGESGVTTQAAGIELEVLADFADWQLGLEHCGAEMERRALRAPVQEMTWELTSDQMVVGFTLPKGSYATVLLRECLDYAVA